MRAATPSLPSSERRKQPRPEGVRVLRPGERRLIDILARVAYQRLKMGQQQAANAATVTETQQQ